MPDNYGAQQLPDDGGSRLVWYCHTFGAGLEYDMQHQCVVRDT
jgi:hypothetical protein